MAEVHNVSRPLPFVRSAVTAAGTRPAGTGPPSPASNIVPLLMSKLTICALIAASVLCGQMPVHPDGARLASSLFDKSPSEAPLACEVKPVSPALTYRLLYRAGYEITVPMGQFTAPKRDFGILVRITPRKPAGAQPLILKDLGTFPSDSGEANRDPSKFEARITGGFMLGEGEYHADLMLVDSEERICRKKWDLDLKSGKLAKTALAAGQLTALPEVDWPHPGARAGSLTVLLNASQTRLNPLLLDSLCGIVDRMPFSRVRVVAFSLDQHKELIRQDVADADGFRRVAEALDNFNPATVSYSVLKDPAGHREFLWQLLAKEELRAEKPDAVLFLGYPTIDDAHVPVPPACAEGTTKTVYAYLEFEPFGGPAAKLLDRGSILRRRGPPPQMPDAISRVTRACSGKVYHIYSPGDFDSALQKTDELVRAR
jgi:hypothetical protein